VKWASRRRTAAARSWLFARTAGQSCSCWNAIAAGTARNAAWSRVPLPVISLSEGRLDPALQPHPQRRSATRPKRDAQARRGEKRSPSARRATCADCRCRHPRRSPGDPKGSARGVCAIDDRIPRRSRSPANLRHWKDERGRRGNMQDEDRLGFRRHCRPETLHKLLVRGHRRRDRSPHHPRSRSPSGHSQVMSHAPYS